MKKTLLTDCDGVLLNWLSRLPDFVEDLGFDSSHLSRYMQGNQFIPFTELFASKTEEEALEKMELYHQSDYLKSLPVMEPDAVDSVAQLSKYYEIIVVTSFSENKKAQVNREENLKLRYGDSISDLICLGLAADKTEVLKNLAKSRDVVMWLDDQIKHVHHGLNAGIDSYQYTHKVSCGRNTGEVKEINSWKEVERMLLKQG